MKGRQREDSLRKKGSQQLKFFFWRVSCVAVVLMGGVGNFKMSLLRKQMKTDENTIPFSFSPCLFCIQGVVQHLKLTPENELAQDWPLQ